MNFGEEHTYQENYIESIINLRTNNRESSIIENHSAMNMNIKPLVPLPEKNLVNNSKTLLQTSLTIKLRNQNFDDESQDICVQRKSTVNVSFVRVIRIHSQMKTSDQLPNNVIHPSVIENSTQLDNHSELTRRINSNYSKVLVRRVLSTEYHPSRS